jgi:hypothetical protein
MISPVSPGGLARRRISFQALPQASDIALRIAPTVLIDAEVVAH